VKNHLFFDFTVNKDNNTISVKRSFDAPRTLVWTAWTDSAILDQWWAPKPYTATTKEMKFEEGGYWSYYMTGPEGDCHYVKMEYQVINPIDGFTAIDSFTDESGVINKNLPSNKWIAKFEDYQQGTLVSVVLEFDSLEDLETIIKMGFKEGFESGLDNLDEYIKTQFYLRKEKKMNNIARVSTYLNFANKTEEAFNYYKTVFGTEFIGGIQRFGDIPPDPSQPPVPESLKNKVIHVELPITSGFILMGTDAPEEMGFEVTAGNNMHINLELTDKQETERIFNELSVDGKISMPLQDMFWGAYFGSFTDKYGINWMLNCQPNTED